MAKIVNKLTGATKTAKPVPVRIVTEGPKVSGPSKSSMDQERKWRAEDDLRTLRRAAEVQADKGRVRDAQKIAKQEFAALERVIKNK